MAGTLRTRSALDTLFADNVAGDISAQDLRDFLWSAPVLLGRVNSAIVGSNLTATVNYHHVLDISGMTAQRDFVIPAGTDEGDMISFHLETDAPSTVGRELRLIGDTGVTLNLLGTDRTATADDAFRYFIKGEGARLRWDATDSKWILAGQDDGRIPSAFLAELTSSTSALAGSTWHDLALDTTVFNKGAAFDTTNNYLSPRRDALWQLTNNVLFSAVADGKRIISSSHIGTTYYNQSIQWLGATTSTSGVSSTFVIELTTTDAVYLAGRHGDSTSRVVSGGSGLTNLSGAEVF